MSCSPHHSLGRKKTSSRDSAPVRDFFDSSGRLYGGSRSRPTRPNTPSAPPPEQDRPAAALPAQPAGAVGRGQAAPDQQASDRAPRQRRPAADSATRSA